MMGAAMLKRHQFVQSLWGWPKCVRGGVRCSPCMIELKGLAALSPVAQWRKHKTVDLRASASLGSIPSQV